MSEERTLVSKMISESAAINESYYCQIPVLSEGHYLAANPEIKLPDGY